MILPTSTLKSYLLFFFVLITIGASGQKDLNKARKAYENHKYYDAIEYYKNVVEYSDNTEAIERLAWLYYKIENYEDAEFWYERAIQLIGNSYFTLRYAQCLQYNGKCELAMQYLKHYQRSWRICDGTYYTDYSKHCSFLDSLKQNPSATIRLMDSLNTQNNDFAPFIFQDQLGCFQNYVKPKIASRGGRWRKPNYITKHEQLKRLINATSFSSNDGETYYYSRFIKYYDNKKISGKIYYQSTTDKGLNRMPFNSDDYTCAYPAISPDGKTMIFSSDMPGGFGGMDFYQSELDSNGRWRAPMNLGPTINTEGNETYPFFQNDSTLYFSSDGHLGFGGIDIYKCKIDFKENEFEITDIETLGSPINTNADDFGIFLDESGKHGYFTSDRDGGKGGDDIWEFWLK